MNFRLPYLIVLFLVLQSFVPDSALAQAAPCDPTVDYISQAQVAARQEDFGTMLHAYRCALENDASNTTLYMERMSWAVLAGDYLTAYGDVFLLNNTTPETILA